MPFTTHVGAIIRALERFRDRDALFIQIARIAFRTGIVGKDSDSRLMRVQSREKRCSGRAASRSVVELSKPQTIRGQAIQIGRTHFPAIATNIRIAHVIIENQEDIGSRGHYSWEQS